MPMNEYVLLYPRCFCRELGYDPSSDVLLVLKNKPSWQCGKLNLVGGKIEPGETPDNAARRELEEESGFSINHDMIDTMSNPLVCGKILGNESIIHCFTCNIYCNTKNLPSILPRAGETEQVSWNKWELVKNDPRLIPNLRVIIPLLANDSIGWTIVEKTSEIIEIQLS